MIVNKTFGTQIKTRHHIR